MNITRKKRYTADEVVALIQQIDKTKSEELMSNLSSRVHVHKRYQLKEMPIDQIEVPDYKLDEQLVVRYVNIHDDNMPPVVFNVYQNEKILIDGGHRILSAKLKGLKTIPVLIGEGTPNWNEYDAANVGF